jgi:hypothetical protein
MKNIRHLSSRVKVSVVKNVRYFSSRAQTSLLGYWDAARRKIQAYPLKKMKDEFKGRRCFIMGNGPSLNKMDLEAFAGEFVWASNKAYLLFDRISWRPSFYVAVDTRVVPDIARDIERIMYPLSNTRCFFPLPFHDQKILSSNPNVFWYYEKKFMSTLDPYEMFTTNAYSWVSSVTTVTIAALQLAVFLGFNPIYLIGCDTNYKVPDTVKFEGGSDYLLSTQNDDPNHFDSSYFGANSRWHQPKPENMLLHYEKAKEVCDALGVRVFNATVGGKLETFPRTDYLEVLKGLQ